MFGQRFDEGDDTSILITNQVLREELRKKLGKIDLIWNDKLREGQARYSHLVLRDDYKTHPIHFCFLARLAFSLLKPRSCNTFYVKNNNNNKNECCKLFLKLKVS